jgi:hypothetical protein
LKQKAGIKAKPQDNLSNGLPLISLSPHFEKTWLIRACEEQATAVLDRTKK